jgi:hypothetical protein
MQQYHKGKSQKATKTADYVMQSLLERFDGPQEIIVTKWLVGALGSSGASLVAGDAGIDGTRPGVDAAGERLGVGEALVA